MEADRPILKAATERLGAAGCVAADLEAAEIIAAARDMRHLEELLRRREQGEPTAWIVGTLHFCETEIRVAEGVYVPRQQTEELARRGAAHLAATPAGARAVDLCTGAGAVALHLKSAVPAARVIAVDIDERAARCARSNGIAVILGDLGGALRPASFDLVTAVAPYVPTGELRYLPADVGRYEPLGALSGGEDGLDLVRRLVEDAARLLRPDGWLLLELGGDQDSRLAPSLNAAGLCLAETWRDTDGDLRGLGARRLRRPSP